MNSLCGSCYSIHEEYRKRERLSYFRGNTEDMPMPADPEGSGRQWVEHWYRRGRNTARVYNPTQRRGVRASGVHGGTCTNDGASKRDIGGSWLAATAAILYDTSAHGTVDCSTADRTKH